MMKYFSIEVDIKILNGITILIQVRCLSMDCHSRNFHILSSLLIHWHCRTPGGVELVNARIYPLPIPSTRADPRASQPQPH